jgi:uncharacterized membrane protein
MGTGRLEAFSDGVIAIIITIMVLELEVPHGGDLEALRPLLPVILAYVLSFVYVGIYWSNHHHLLHATERVNGVVLWANLHLLFWMSLIPFVTAWLGERGGPWPTALYGVVLFMTAVAYVVLEWAIVACQGKDSALATAVGRDRKALLSLASYALAIALAFAHERLAHLLYVAVAVSWFVPDRRIAAVVKR